MGFLGLGRAKWRHRDAKVRLAAVRELDPRHAALVRLAAGDPDPAVRTAAAERVADEDALRRLVGAADEAVRAIAGARLGGLAATAARSRPLAACRDLIQRIDDQRSLVELALAAADQAVRDAALDRLLALPEPSEALLSTIAIQDEGGARAARALARIGRRAALKDVARKAKHADIRAGATAAMERIDREAERPSPEKRRRARQVAIEPLATRAAQLAVASDAIAAAAEVPLLDERWRTALDPFADLPLEEPTQRLAERFARSLATARSRAVEAEARRERQAGARREREAVIAEIAALPAAAAAAEADARRQALQARWDALAEVTEADRATLDAAFRAALATAAADPAQPRPAPVEPTEADRAELEAVCAEAERLAVSDEWRDAAHAFATLHKRWSAKADPLAGDHPLKARFLAAHALLKGRRREAREARDVRNAERLRELELLAVDAEALAGDEAGEPGARWNRLRELQARWRGVGPARGERLETLRTRFRAACDRVAEPLRAWREAEDWQRFANLARSDELIARVEALAAVEDVPTLAREIKAAQADWKRTGPLPRDKDRDQWQRFKTACDAQYERCRAWFAQQDVERQGNLERKRVLLDEAERLSAQPVLGLPGSQAEADAKRGRVERFKAIQLEWNAIGPVPRGEDRELWPRFRKACDAVFGDWRQERRREHEQNQQVKEELIARVEALAATAASIARAVPADRDRWFRQLRDWQAEWKAIGHVPMERKEELWRRFRAAADQLYDLTRDPAAAKASQPEGPNPPAEASPPAPTTGSPSAPASEARPDEKAGGSGG